MSFPGIAPIAVPEGSTVWAASDVHGQRDAFDRLLATAGLTDGADRWIAPPDTALVITGDIVDRGPDSVGLVRRLAALRDQAPAHRGLVALVEGNHEVELLGGLAGVPEIWRALLTFGGGATLVSAGLEPGEWERLTPLEVAARVDAFAPDFRPVLQTFAPYATWGDVLFVHGGPVPFQGLDAWVAGEERLWIRDAWSASPYPFPDHGAWAAYRDAGMARVVYGHTPVAEPTLIHGGRGLNLDTWRGGVVTLAELQPELPLAEARYLTEPAEDRVVADGPITREEIKAIDAAMFPAVRAWWASLRDAALDPGAVTDPGSTS
ncbi:MAG TPA: metallophosphoesterase family protein [Candidatus Limnocylindrales bacterium]|nr:metallophosphoesterase family protein [Candidatus Limnocylindrales bacterium]